MQNKQYFRRKEYMLKKITLSLISMLLLVTVGACGNKNVGTSTSSNSDFEANDGKVKVVVSFNALAQFTKAIGKDKVDVQTIIPKGTEAHDFEPKPKDLTSLSKAKIFVYNGLGMESWVDKTIKQQITRN